MHSLCYSLFFAKHFYWFLAILKIHLPKKQLKKNTTEMECSFQNLVYELKGAGGWFKELYTWILNYAVLNKGCLGRGASRKPKERIFKESKPSWAGDFVSIYYCLLGHTRIESSYLWIEINPSTWGNVENWKLETHSFSTACRRTMWQEERI